MMRSLLQLAPLATVVLLLAVLPGDVSARGRRKTLLHDDWEDAASLGNSSKSATRDEKFMSLFHIVRFKADECEVSGNTGICLAEAQCSQDGGRALGHCASGK